MYKITNALGNGTYRSTFWTRGPASPRWWAFSLLLIHLALARLAFCLKWKRSTFWRNNLPILFKSEHKILNRPEFRNNSPSEAPADSQRHEGRNSWVYVTIPKRKGRGHYFLIDNLSSRSVQKGSIFPTLSPMKCAHSWTISPKCSWICRSRHYCREYIHIQPHTSLNCEGDSDPNWSTEVWKFIGLHIQTLEMHRWSKNPCIHHVGSPVDQVAFKNCRWTCFKLPHIHILLIRSTQPRILDRNQAQRDCTIKPLDSCCRSHFTWRTQMQLLFTWSQKCAELQFRFLDIQPNELRSKWDHKDQVYKLVAQTAAISVIQRLYCSLVITQHWSGSDHIHVFVSDSSPLGKREDRNLSALHK